VPKRPPLTSEQKLERLAVYDKMSLNQNRLAVAVAPFLVRGGFPNIKPARPSARNAPARMRCQHVR
jgi:hypothetical protein